MPFNVTNFPVRDGDSVKKRLIAYYTGSDYAFGNALLNSEGAIIDPATAGHQVTAHGKLDQIITNTTAKSIGISATPPITAAAYSTGMVVGGKIALAAAARSAGGSGLLQQAFVAKRGASLTTPFDLYVFHTDPATTFTDRAAMPDFAADISKLAGVIQCADLYDSASVQIVQSSAAALQFDLPSGSTSLYVVPVIRGSETYASTTAVTFSFGILQD
jgi:hypothetical protein